MPKISILMEYNCPACIWTSETDSAMSNKGRVNFKKLLSETDFASQTSIEHYAAHLDGMTFRDILELGIAPANAEEKDYGSVRFKGGMGNLIEERYFGYKANSDDRPDFPEAGVELKATCFDLRKDGTKSAGERLVLTMIPYDREVTTDYEKSHLKTKLNTLLLVYYHRDRTIDKYDQRIERAVMVHLPEKDLRIIRSDYKKITTLLQQGRADELSEGMTSYLGACTKGANEKSMWADQHYPFIDPQTGEQTRRKAKKRAFSLKRSFMDYLLHNYVLNAPKPEESILPEDSETADFDSYVLNLIDQHVGKTDRQIAQHYGLPYTGNKAQWTMLIYRMLGIKNNSAEEFVKAGISVRVARADENGAIKESMSFTPFKFKRIAEESWDESDFHVKLESSRFLWVLFQRKEDGDYHLEKAVFWAMPIEDIEGPAKACWEETKSTIIHGVQLKRHLNSSGKLTVENNLPKISGNPVSHVRPHSSKAAYLFEDGMAVGNLKRDSDELPDGRRMTKQSFWLNNSYIEKILGTR